MSGPRWVSTTPARLKALVGGGWLLAFILGAIIMSSTREHHDAVNTIAKDHAPSVGSAHRIKVEIESLDADLVNEMLVPESEAKQWAEDFAQNRVELGLHLINATRHVYNETEIAPIQRMQESLGRYLMVAQSALDAHRRGDDQAALGHYRESYRILESELVPAATTLHELSDADLEAEYEQQIRHSHRVRTLIAVVGFALVGLFVLTQVYLYRRFRRRLSPWLIVAVALTVVLVGYTLRAFTVNDNALTSVKKDAYDSASTLLEVRAYAFEANSSESRWLLDASDRSAQENRFREYLDKVIAIPQGGTFDTFAEAIRQRNDIMARRMRDGDSPGTAGKQARDQVRIGYPGKIVKALDNIKFIDKTDPTKDEPTQALATVRNLALYQSRDARIRELETSGEHAKAVAYCIGKYPNDSNWAFEQFDTALGHWIDLNEAWMAHYADKALGAISKLPIVAPLLTLLIAACIALALRPRIREYA